MQRPFRSSLLTKCLATIFSLVAAGATSAQTAAGLTTRDVTRLLFLADPANPPDLSGQTLVGLDLSSLDFKHADLEGADLFGSDLTSSNLRGSNLRNARLDRATISSADFSGADLTKASILRPNVYSSLNAMHAQRPIFVKAEMAGANISGHLELASFRGANLMDAVFGRKNPSEEVLISPRMRMYGCDFTDAVLVRANLSFHQLGQAKFVNADLTDAVLRGADLSGADFTGSRLFGADFTGAKLDGARFDGAAGIDEAINLSAGAARRTLETSQGG